MFIGDAVLDDLARELTESDAPQEYDPIEYRTWGTNINDRAHQQLPAACRIPAAVGAALMPDAHVGYGLPIGGVLATQDVVIPYAVGVNIASGIKISVLDIHVETLEKRSHHYRNALENGTRFGVDSIHKKRLTYYNALNDRNQLLGGHHYRDLRPANSICVLNRTLYRALPNSCQIAHVLFANWFRAIVEQLRGSNYNPSHR